MIILQYTSQLIISRKKLSMGRKRKEPTGTCENRAPVKMAKALFQDVMDGSIHTAINPLSCIPLTKVRGISSSGVMRLKSAFRGGGGRADMNYVAGSDSPIVVPLQGVLQHHILEHFTGFCKMSENDAKEKMKSRSTWFGVVDGMHRLAAIKELIHEQAEIWEQFLWPVTLLKGDCSIQVLRQLARQQNSKHNDAFYIEDTFFDVLKGLRDEADHLSGYRNGKKPLAKDVAVAYDGYSHHRESTIKQIANTAMRLPREVIDVIGEIINGEHPDLVGENASSDPNSVMEKVDCRVFRRFVHVTSLKSATVFMKAPESMGEEGVKCQIHTLRRVAELSLLNRKNSDCIQVKSVQPALVAQQFAKSVLAFREAQKFSKFLETDVWPPEMHAVRHNLLNSTRLDEDVEQNAGNVGVLPLLLEKYRKHFPVIAVQKEQKYIAASKRIDSPQKHDVEESSSVEVAHERVENTSVELETAERSSSQVVSSPPLLKSFPSRKETEETKDSSSSKETQQFNNTKNNSHEQLDSSASQELSVNHTQESERLETNKYSLEDTQGDAPPKKGNQCLKDIGISCFQMDWREFDKTTRRTGDKRFDMMLIDPPYGNPDCRSRAGSTYTNYVDDEEMKEVAQFGRRTLVPGGSVFIFTSVQYANGWMKALQTESYKVMRHLFIVTKNTSGLQTTRTEFFPQNSCEYGVLAFSPGIHPEAFKPDFQSPYSLVECSENRKFSTISGVAVPRHKLLRPGTKSPVLTEEKNPGLLAELMTTFCPQGGSVIDIYAGTFTTAIAAMMTGRVCTSIEKDTATFRMAQQRLQRLSLEYQPRHPNPPKRARISRACKKIPPGQTSLLTSNEEFKNGSHAATTSCEGDHLSQFNPSDVTNKANRHNEDAKKLVQTEFQIEDDVALFLGARKVGTARLLPPRDGQSIFCTTLHGHLLNEKPSIMHTNSGVTSFLVAVCNVSIQRDAKEEKYPYHCPGQEEAPQVLGGLMKSGIYSWDACFLTPIRQGDIHSAEN